MQVILLDNIRGVGYIGDIKNVTDGYARNFLLPRKLVKLATPQTIKESAKLREKREILLAQEKERATQAAGKLADFVLTFEGKASPTGTLFAAIGRRDIVKSIKDTTGLEIEDVIVRLLEPLKTVGEHPVELHLAPEVSVRIKVVISPKKE